MPAPFQQCEDGKLINNMPSGFPLFFDKRKPRVVSADPWSYMATLAYDTLNNRDADRASSFIDQAYDFFEAARNPSFGSKPLLYYYSFLNLVKAALLIQHSNIPISVKHGIADPKSNNNERLYFTKQSLKINALKSDKSLIMPEFIKILGADSSHEYNFKILDLLSRIPSIHKTYSSVLKKKPIFVPVDKFEIYSNEGNIWARILLEKNEKNVTNLKNSLLKKVNTTNILHRANDHRCPNFILLETEVINTGPKWIDNGITKLSQKLRSFGIYSILTSHGYRYYLSTLPISAEFPQLASAYAIIFYLGSITRYRPGDFTKIVKGKYSWIIDEFLATQPTQFIYYLISYVSGVDVVKPYASID